MNCFMSYNPNVAKEVKITTWIKEFDGASPVYPSFPNEGDVFIVFDTDEAKEPSVNKTYTSGEWADTSSGGGGGGGDFSTAEVTVTVNDGAENTINMPIIYDSEYSALLTLIPITGTSTYTVPLFKGEADISLISQGVSITTTGSIEYVSADGYIAVTGDGSITISEA